LKYTSKAFLSLGGNIGDTRLYIKKVFQYFSKNNDIQLIKISHFYKTTPVSTLKQRYFINCACCIKTSLSPFSLLKSLQEIEKKIGKKEKPKTHPRIIDIDIIFFDDVSLDTEKLTIPHPQWGKRLFVLQPLNDLQNSFTITKKNETMFFKIDECIKNFNNKNNEKIIIINKKN
jgi:2-amino-4-hydroxy-6-hydroxymethyldihydropteridine diphosphokinase